MPIAQAFSECKVDGYAAVFLENGSLFSAVKISDGKFQGFYDTWEECYKFAMRKARELPETMDLVATGRRVKGGRQETTAEVFFVWKFDDGGFWKARSSSTGMLTARTPEVSHLPRKGDLRVRKNGARFED